MKKNVKYTEIDLTFIVKIILQEKMLIIFTLLISLTTACIYSESIEKKFSTSVIINDPDLIIFNKINKIFQNYQSDKIFTNKNFQESITNKILSKDTFFLFLDSKKNIKSSQKKNFNIKKLIYNKQEVPNGFELTYPELVNGVEIIRDYIIFVQLITINEYQKKIDEIFSNYIEYLNDQKNIAKSINLKNSFVENLGLKSLEFFDSYLEGENILSEKILITNRLKKSINENNLQYNIFFEKPSNQILNTPNQKKIIFIGLLIGSIVSFLLIFFKLNKNKF